MESKLKELMSKDEKLIWQGKVQNINVFDKTNKGYALIKLIVGLSLLLGLSLLYIIDTLNRGNKVQWLIVFIIAIIFGFIAIKEILEANKLKKAEYFLTDKNLFNLSPDRSIILPLSSFEIYSYTVDADGNTSLRVGKNAQKIKDYKLRNACTYPPDISEKTGKCTKAVFYNIPDIDNFKQTLSSLAE